MVMDCPTCGKKFHSDFKLGIIGRSKYGNAFTTIFDLPYKTLKRFVGFITPAKKIAAIFIMQYATYYR
jgi:hypothetical protein